ncbi:MAG: exosortase/archaeosortase family protein [Nitrospinota bacterium]
MTPRNIFFLFFNIVAFIVFYVSLRDLLTLSFHKEVYSHIVLIPLVSGYFMYSERKIIFSDRRYSFAPGMIFIIIGIILYVIGRIQGGKLNQNDYFSLMTFAALVFWLGGFVLFYGIQSFRNIRFPFLFLIFMIPIPTLILDKIVLLLQKGSAEAAYGFFLIAGIPFVREGFTFHLPEFSVEVARQCSGIRSSIALFITSVLTGHLFLGTGWRKIVLTLSIFPITMVKNGLRITILTLLGAYVDRTFITNSFLHKKGGVFFFVLALLLLTPILWFLRRSEKREEKK